MLALILATAVSWPCNFPNASSHNISVYRGETIELQPLYTAYNQPVTNVSFSAAWYQTNGMGQAWWPLPDAVFAPSNDVGAASYRFFVAATNAVGEILYRANGTLRMLDSPGFVPNTITPPVQVIDFDTITVLNAPWLSADVADESYQPIGNYLTEHQDISHLAPKKGDIVSIVTNDIWWVGTRPSSSLPNVNWSRDADLTSNGENSWTYERTYNNTRYVGALSYTGTNYWDLVYTSSQGTYYHPLEGDANATELGPESGFFADPPYKGIFCIKLFRETEVTTNYAEVVYSDTLQTYKPKQAAVASPAADATEAYQFIDSISQDANGVITATKKTMRKASTSAPGMVRLNDNTNSTRTDHAATANALRRVAESITACATTNDLAISDRIVHALILGTNVMDVVTNYGSEVHIPERYLVQFDSNGVKRVVWNEMTQITNAMTNVTTTLRGEIADAVAGKADKAWSHHTSGLGLDAPADTTWISTPELVIAGGYEFSKTVTSGGQVWVLSSNGMGFDFMANPQTNAFLNISALDGTPIFRVEKTDATLIGVDPSAIEVVDNTLFVAIPIVANAHPYARASTNLTSGVWYLEDENGMPSGAPCSVSWSGSSGAWVCTADFSQSPQAFLYFEFLREGETKIISKGTLDLTGGIIFNGVKYYPTVNGNKLEFVAP